MTYMSGAQIIEFDCVLGAGRIAVASSGLDFSDDGIDDVSVILCPIPLLVYGCGIYVTESLSATLDADLTLQVSTVIAGTDRTIVAYDLDAVTAVSGGAGRMVAGTTAAGGSESSVAGDVRWMNSSSFPILIKPGSVLTLLSVDQSTGAGECLPFIYAKWMAMDFRPTNIWVNQT